MTTEPGFGIYVHWPFCLSKCPYCDFNSHVARAVDMAPWRAALTHALTRMADRVSRQTVGSVFFGGGTPSLMPPETVGAVLDEIARLFPLADDLEVTLEANPTSVEAARFAGFRAAGVNRVSIGVQALDDADLRALGRTHSATEALGAVAIAAKHFPRYSFDLIYARPNQTEKAWRAELARALALGPEHLSLYQLTYEEGTPFGAALARGTMAAMPEEPAAELYAVTQELCEAAGLPAYEISNHARPGAACRHNLVYWRYGTYLGVGPGAHGRLDGVATVSARDPKTWLTAVEAGGDGIETADGLTLEERASEYLLMSLRLSEGSDLARFSALRGAALPDERIAALEEAGVLQRTGTRICATPSGRLVLNRVIAELLG
jgi:oxygen-independent coproporphyrinogen-3 oxidase